jgi:hypothetical protein
MPLVASSITLGAAAGSSESFVLNRAVTFTAQALTLGDRGDASFIHSDGQVRAQAVTLGRSAHGRGSYAMSNAASLNSQTLTIGDAGTGSLNQRDTSSVHSQVVALGNQSTGNGVYNLFGGTLSAPAVYVGVKGTGTFNQFDGHTSIKTNTGDAQTASEALASAAVAETGLHVGKDIGSHGSFNLHNGTVTADDESIGHAGSGSFHQDGGVNTVTSLRIGASAKSSGTYELSKGQIQIARVPEDSPQAGEPRLVIGMSSTGSLKIGGKKHAGEIKEVGKGAPVDVVVRAKPSASGAIVGHGAVSVTGQLDENGVVVADGYGSARDLDLSSVNLVRNTIDNPVNGANGWYARRGGKLELPAIHVEPGTHSYTWGDDATDVRPDLVNSVRVTLHNARSDDPDAAMLFSLALMSPDRPDAPAIPSGEKLLGLWHADASSFTADAMDLLIRYDSSDVAFDNPISIWSYNDDHWSAASNGPISLDPIDHLISAQVPPSPYFAVLATNEVSIAAASPAPEPGVLGVIGVSVSSCLTRRRRR